MSRFIMGKTTRDPHGQKNHIEVIKYVKFGVDRANIEQDTAICNLKITFIRDVHVWIAGHIVHTSIYIVQYRPKTKLENVANLLFLNI